MKGSEEKPEEVVENYDGQKPNHQPDLDHQNDIFPVIFALPHKVFGSRIQTFQNVWGTHME